MVQQDRYLAKWTWDLRTGIVKGCPEMFRMWGMMDTEPEISSKLFMEIVYPDDRSILQDLIDTLDKRNRAMINYRIVRPDGEVRLLHTEAEAVFDETNKLIKIEGVNQDITDQLSVNKSLLQAQKHTEKLLEMAQAERDRLTALLNSISDEVWYASKDKKFTLMNSAALREFALTEDNVCIESLASELEVYRPDGSPRPIEEAPPLRALNGEIIRNQ